MTIQVPFTGTIELPDSIITVPPVVPSTDPLADVRWLSSFESSPTEGGFILQARSPTRATLVDVARHGDSAVRLTTQPYDHNIAGSGDRMERCDLMLSQPLTDGFEGREHWWAHSILFPNDFALFPDGSPGPKWHNYIVFDFHNTSLGDWQANFHVGFQRQANDANPGLLAMWGYGGTVNAANRFEATVGEPVRNHWYDFVYHVRWSSGADGFFDAWVDGQHLLSHQGPTLYTGQGVYLKLANYHNPICDPFPDCIGTHRASSVIHDRVIRGTSWQAVSNRSLEGL